MAENPNVLKLLMTMLELRDEANANTRLFSKDVLELMDLVLIVLHQEGILANEGNV